MSETQTSIRQIASQRFCSYLKETGWVHNSSKKISQTGRATLRSSIFSFQHQFHSQLSQRQKEIDARQAEWEEARKLGLKFSSLETESIELAEKVKNVVV